jgi:hypothetical protein
VKQLLSERLFVVWLALIAVTLISAQIGGTNGLAGTHHGAAVTIAVLAIAFAKVAIVMFTYMDVRQAPRALKIVATTWLVVVLSVLVTVYVGAI